MEGLKVTPAKTLKVKPADESKLGFGKLFTDNMLIIDYQRDKGWHDARIEEYHSFDMDPASMVLHYGQAIFEGMKAYRAKDGRVLLFRPRDNFTRMNSSAERICIPALDEDFALGCLTRLVDIERDWVPASYGTSLYIRPTIIATDPYLGVRASDKYIFFVILSPVGAYYASGLEPVKICVESKYVRSVRGGTGFTKFAGNYATSLIGSEAAHKLGYSQVLWLDAIEQRYIEEVGSMNIFFVIDGELVTPALSGSILPGITRDSVIKYARHKGLKVAERAVTIDELYSAHEKGKLNEAFGTGTAAVISPVGSLTYKDKELVLNGGKIGPIGQMMYDSITGIQYGELEDPFGWVYEVK